MTYGFLGACVAPNGASIQVSIELNAGGGRPA